MYRLIAMTLIITLTSLMTTTRLAATTADTLNQAASADLLRSYVEKLPVGSIVKVKMKEGKDVKGTLMVIEPGAIVVKPKTRIARPERRLPYSDIEFVELQTRNGGNIAKSIAIGMATGAGAFLGLILLTVAIIDD
jgi:hypothetical protein